MNFFLIATIVFFINSNTIQSAFLLEQAGTAGSNDYTAHEIFEKCKVRAAEIDSTLKSLDFEFTQKIEFQSRGGDNDRLVFRIIIRHGKVDRQLISTTIPNGDRFNGGYDAFDRMFFLSEYFSPEGQAMTSCEFEKPARSDCYGINFVFSKTLEQDDPLNTVTASLTTNDFTPVYISERVNGLPLGAEFDDEVNISYDKDLNVCYPNKIMMRVYAHLFFLKGEIATVKIKNENLKRI